MHVALRVGAAEYGVQAGELFLRRGLPALKRRAAVARKAEVAAGENPLLRPDAPGVGEVFLYERVGRAGLGGVFNPLHDDALAGNVLVALAREEGGRNVALALVEDLVVAEGDDAVVVYVGDDELVVLEQQAFEAVDGVLKRAVRERLSAGVSQSENEQAVDG